MTTKHEIEIPDLPEGWRAVAYRIPIENIDYVFIPHKNEVRLCDWETKTYRLLIVEKIKRHQIVLEETGEFRQVNHEEYYFSPARRCVVLWIYPYKSDAEYRIWRVVEEEQ